ncbi:unnamed protein product [Schistocephalus solidus]|uniref:Nucleolar protein 4 helical domain-containing protein n=1 Tax=Schistocephalus solidus TaxID=70667 RepID=A0A183TCI6_SCHSO|nr:unnamed protein product [Schistocephalus solidus]
MLDTTGAQQQQEQQQLPYLACKTDNQNFPMATSEGDTKAIHLSSEFGAVDFKAPTSASTSEASFSLFIKQLAVELLDRRLTIVQQPRHRLAQLEAACQRQFPGFNERQIRLKVRGQLKLYRRNLKKAEERMAGGPKSTSSSSVTGAVFSIQSPSGQTSNTCLIVPSSNLISTNGTKFTTELVDRPSPFYTVAANGIHTLLPSSETYSTCNPSVVRLAQTALLNEQRRKGQICHEVLSQTSVNGGIPRTLQASGTGSLVASSASDTQTPRTQKFLPELRPNLQPSQSTRKTVATNDTAKFSTISMPFIPVPFEQSQKTPNILSSAVNLSIRGGTSTSEKNQHQALPMKAYDAVLTSAGLNQTLPTMPVFNEPSIEASQLNETWPLPDPPNTIIASCLRLTANFLIQSAAFFENKAITELPSCLPLLSTPLLSMPFYPSFSDPPTLASTPLKVNQTGPVLAPPPPVQPTVASVQMPQQMTPVSQVQLIATALPQPHPTPPLVSSVPSSTPALPNPCGRV